MKKLLLPALAMLVAIALIVGMWLALRPEPVPSNTPPGNQAQAREPGKADPAPEPQHYDPAVYSPDPVVSEPPPQFNAPRADARLEVSGRVVTEAGLFVPDALVRFIGEGGLRDVTGAATTDASGRYLLVAIAGRVLPDRDRKGRVFAQAADGGFGVSASVDLPAAPQAEMPDVVLAAPGILRGRVLDDAGAGAAGVVVIVRSVDTHDSPARGTRAMRVQHQYLTATSTTDSRGDYEVKGLRPGRYYVDADRSWHGIKKDTAEATVRAGDTTVADVQVSALHHLRGTVRDSDGRPVQGAIVRAQGAGLENAGGMQIDAMREGFRRAGERPIARPTESPGLGGLPPCVTDAQGRFGWFALRPGKWRVSTMVGASFDSREDLSPGGDEISLVVQTKASVSGVVRSAEGGAVEFFDVRVVKGGDAVSPFDRVAEDRALPFRPMGEFRVLNPGSGDRLRFSAPGFLPASLAIPPLEAGERRQGLEVTLQPLCDLTLTLRHAGAPLDIEPVLFLFAGSLAAQSTTDASGRVRLSRVAPARYEILLIQRDGTKLGATLDVPGRSRAALEVELQPAENK